MEKKRLNIKEFVLHMMPCTCAGYYKDARKIDPHCYTCNNIDKLLPLIQRIKSASYQEGYWNGKRGETSSPPPDSFWLTCKKTL